MKKKNESLSDNNSVINPFNWVAKQECGSGKPDDTIRPFYVCYPTNEKFAGLIIPEGVDAEKYLELYPQFLLSVSNEGKENQSGFHRADSNEKKEKTQPDAVCNFCVIPLEKLIFRNRFGISARERETILCKVFVADKSPEEFEVKTCEIDKLVKMIRRRFSCAVVDYSDSNAEKMIESEFRIRTYNIPKRFVLFEAGWQKVRESYVYVYDGVQVGENITVETGMRLPRYSELSLGEIGNIALHALKLYKEERVMHNLFLYSLLGVLYKPFQEAGHAPHFLLFINGRTGSMKTSLAKILFMQLTNAKYAKNPRRIDSDTTNSFERALVMSGRDTVLLFDDYAPAKTSHKKREMEEKLETLVRMVGDGATKSRSNAKLEDVQGEGMQGMAVVTGELKGKGTSSNLRCFYCNMAREKVNLECLTWFQTNEFAYTSLIAYFADFVAGNWNQIQSLIAKEFNEKRLIIKDTITEKRLIDSATTLYITLEIFERFMVNFCGFDKKFIEGLGNSMCESIILQTKINENMIKGEDYSEIFLKGIDSLMGMNHITLAKTKSINEQISAYDGFEDTEFYYFLPEIVYKKVVSFVGQMGTYIPFNLREIVEILWEDGIIKKSPNGSGKATFYARISIGNGRKQKYLKISKEIFAQVVEGRYRSYAENCFEGGIWDE